MSAHIWTQADERERDAIVHQLRMRGWDKYDSNEEADRLMSERIERRNLRSAE